MKTLQTAKLLVLLLLSFVATSDTTRQFYKFRSVTGTLNRVSIVQTTRQLQLRFVWFKCSVACTWSITKNGTASGGTGSTAELVNEKGYAATATILLDGTITGDTTVNTETLAAGGDLPVAGSLLLPVATNRKINLALTSNSSGTLTIYTEFDEP